MMNSHNKTMPAKATSYRDRTHDPRLRFNRSSTRSLPESPCGSTRPRKSSRSSPMAKKTSAFDDPTMEMQELTALIKEDIKALNSAVVDLQLLSNSQNEGSSSSDSSAHSMTVVDNLKGSLMSTTKEFKEALTMRTQNLKVHENRRQLFSSSVNECPTVL